MFDSPSSEWERISGEGTLSIEEHSAKIIIPANHTSKWKLVMEPVWIYRFQELHITYRASHLQTGNEIPFLTFDAGIIPAQPDTGKPITEWNQADKLVMDSSSLIPDGEIHELIIPVYEYLRTNQLDEIVIELHSSGEDAVLEIVKFDFINTKLSVPITIHYEKEWTESSTSYQIIPLLHEQNSGIKFERLPETLPNKIESNTIPFLMPDNRIFPSTSFYGRGTMTIPIQQSCSEVFLLMGCNLLGSDYSFQMIERDKIRDPERLVIEKIYSDRTVERSFPYHTVKKDYVVDTEYNAYIIPADPSKTLQEIRVLEWMSYGSVSLAAVTTNNTDKPLFDLTQNDLPWVSAKEKWQPQDINPSLTVHENKHFILQNSHYRMELSAENGLWITHVSHQKNQHSMLSQPSPLFALLSNTLPVKYEDIRVVSFQAEEKRIQFYLNGGTIFPIELLLTININDSDSLEMALELTNKGAAPSSMKMRFPLLENLNISPQVDDDFYFFPGKRAAWGNQPVRVSGVYSGDFPLQWMDLYSQVGHVGVALHTLDEKLNVKKYLLMKDETSSRMAVEYGHFQSIQLQSGEQFNSATSTIQIHDGDWHAAIKRYQDRSQNPAASSGKNYNQLNHVFIARRDYPIGGTDLLFEGANNHYTFEKLIADSNKYFGGVGLLDISGWQYTKEHGAIGAYEQWEIGAVDDMHQNTSSAQERSVLTGLFLSGYLIDERCGIDPALLREWQLIDKDGSPLKRSETEMYMNPFHPDWQKHLSETAMRVLDMSGAQALYLDQMGFADDDKADFSNRFAFPFGHPLLGEHVLLAQMRYMLDWMDRPTAIYTEQVPVDLTARLLDGACSFGMTGDRDYPSPTRLNAFHYAFPQFKIFEKIQPGIFPKAVDASLVKLCFFHGHGLWLKGKAQSWYSRECREVIQKAHRIYTSHQDVFATADLMPMIPTLQRGLYANQFHAQLKQVITIYNATPQTINGALLACENQTGHVVDEWGIPDFTFKHDEDGIIISGTLHPHEVGCFMIE